MSLHSTSRADFRLITEIVPPGSRVLDLGCGDGSLLKLLVDQRSVTARGVEIDEANVAECIARGLAVYHGDLLEGLSLYGERSFDLVILSQTLQVTIDPLAVVSQMLRVGVRGIVSFPNFALWSVRLNLLLRGRMPKTKLLPYEWYNTPNIHLLTVKDFLRFCRYHGFRIVRRDYLDAGNRRWPALWPNLLAGTAIFVLEKEAGRSKDT
jgi:methionine biosynthesis protein MetW